MSCESRCRCDRFIGVVGSVLYGLFRVSINSFLLIYLMTDLWTKNDLPSSEPRVFCCGMHTVCIIHLRYKIIWVSSLFVCLPSFQSKPPMKSSQAEAKYSTRK